MRVYARYCKDVGTTGMRQTSAKDCDRSTKQQQERAARQARARVQAAMAAQCEKDKRRRIQKTLQRRQEKIQQWLEWTIKMMMKKKIWRKS